MGLYINTIARWKITLFVSLSNIIILICICSVLAVYMCVRIKNMITCIINCKINVLLIYIYMYA